MTLRVSVFDINRSSKRAYRFLVDRTQVIVQPPILFSLAFNLSQQVMAMYADRDVASQRADDFEILFAELLPAGFLSQQDNANQAFANYQRHQQFNLRRSKELFVIVEEPPRLRGSILQR